jgi:hypothetical protein
MFSKCYRRFGVEIEYNSFDKLSRSVGFNGLPSGIYNIADILSDVLKEEIEINRWHNTNNNNLWVVKPDSSCGIEVCSPPKIHHNVLNQIYNSINAISKNNFIEADNRCSFHIHVEIEDFDDENLKSIVYNWLIFEPIFFACCSSNRWINNYCKPLSFSFNISNTDFIDSILDSLMENKYFAINLCNYKKKKKRTVEIRIMGGEACLSPDLALNWCKLILCFVEQCKKNTLKPNYSDINYGSFKDFDMLMNLDDFFGNNKMKLWVKERVKIIYDMFKDSADLNILTWLKIIENYVERRGDFNA